MPVGSAKARALRAVTRCATLEEFVAGYARFASDDGIFVVTRAPRAAGPARPFVVQLADGSTVLRGTAEVVEAHEMPTGPDAQCGMQLRYVDLDDQSREVHRQLLEERDLQKDGDEATPAPSPALIAATATHTIHAPTPLQPYAPRPLPTVTQATITPVTPTRPSPPRLPPVPAVSSMAPTVPVAVPQVRPPAPDGLAAVSASATLMLRPRAIGSRPPPVTPGEAAREERTPGSPYVLPANPFSELAPESLEHFVECTLYEYTDVSSFEAVLGGDARRPPRDPSPPEIDPAYPGPFAYSPAPTYWPAPTPRRTLATVAIVAALIGLATGYLLRGDPPATSPPAPAALAVLAPTPDAARPAPQPQRSPSPALAPSPSPEPQPSPPPPPSPSPSPSPSPPPSPPPPPPPSPSAATDPTTCTARIKTDATAVKVRWADADLGTTPLPGPVTVPCGPATVTFTHPRRTRETRTVTAAAGEPLTLSIAMGRPDAPLELRSSPPGAAFIVDGTFVGRGPTRTTVPGWTFVTISAELPGHKPYRERVYVKGSGDSINARLERRK